MNHVKRPSDFGALLTPLGALTWAARASALGLVLLIAVRWESYQWDLHMFYGSAEDFRRGINPYKGVGLSFFHPPLMLYVYQLLTLVPVKVACALWLGLKVGALLALLRLWHREFLPLSPSWQTVAFFVLAYNGALYCDLVAGNVSIFEELGLWYAFSFVLRGRYLAFCLLLAAVSQIKLAPVVFAGLLLVVPSRPQWGWFAGSLSAFCALFSLNHWLQPDLLRSFFKASRALDERGTDNATFLSLIRDILDVMNPRWVTGTLVDETLFVGLALGISGVSLLAIRHHRSGEESPNGRLLILFVCLLFAVVSPRFKGYTAIVLLVPTLAWLREQQEHLVPLAASVVALLVLLPNGESLLPFRGAFRLAWTYLPLLTAGLVWFGYARRLFASRVPRAIDQAQLLTKDAPPIRA